MLARPTAPKPDAWRRNVLYYIAEHPDRPLKPRGLARELRVCHADYPEFRALLRGMVAEGTLVLGPGRTVLLPDHAGMLVGKYCTDRRGNGRVEIPGRTKVLVRRGFTGGALDGDTVGARLLKRRGPRGVRVVEITRVIERAEICWTGVLERRGARWVVEPQGRKAAPLVQIDDPTAKSARPGDMVAVEPIEHTLGAETVRGVIVERLGDPGSAETKVRAVARRYGIPEPFPPSVRRAAQRAGGSFDPGELRDREDLRDLLTVTIDPPDARDFDDAITLRALPKGQFELGVHIADVAHFVRADGVLDREARRRGNSVYFPGYVVPMLPEVLSNGVCSLQERQSRVAQSVFITYDKDAIVCETRFARSVICSDKRLTYDQVTRILAGKGEGAEQPIVHLLRDADRLARRIRQRRLRAGMIVLSMPEVEIRLGDDGEVVDAGAADTSFSHTIIEMFMVEANEAVSRFLRRNGVPHLRRIHPPPQQEADGRLRQLAAALGQRLSDHIERGALQRLLDAARGRPEEPAVNLAILRAMSLAVYSTDCEGHFALASEDYCHFTSPIRRYPDLVNHRLLTRCLAKGRRSKGQKISDADLAEFGAHTSMTERRAQQAEREAKTVLLLELMKSKVGEELDGTVVGVAAFGVFVQVRPYLAEGLVHVSDLQSFGFEHDAQEEMLISRRLKRVIAVGQQVRVRVVRVDEARQELTLAPAEGDSMGAVRETRAPATVRRGRKPARSARTGRRGGRRRA